MGVHVSVCVCVSFQHGACSTYSVHVAPCWNETSSSGNGQWLGIEILILVIGSYR